MQRGDLRKQHEWTPLSIGKAIQVRERASVRVVRFKHSLVQR